tara:strand:- start:77 stop:640 length:564 start_codon:yes stop_codon:yes gene_type:complete
MKLRFLILTTIFSCFFNLIFYVLFTRTKLFSEVLFLRGNLSTLLGFLISWIFLIIISYFIYKNNLIESIILNFYSSALPSISILLFHSLILVSLERSITVYTLSYLDLHYGDIKFTENDFKKIINEKYMSNTNIASKRIKEQIKIGYINKVGDSNYILTTKAKKFLSNSRLLAQLFRLKRTFLWPDK